MSDDPYVKELLPGYIARRREEVVTLRQALEQNDLKKLRLTGHNLHGSGAAYGLPRISELGRALERAAAADDTAAVSEVLDTLQSYVDTL
ncbi:MAG: Hpt domain-containing protein [Gammaproteobacteria bacterium]|nr:Hpt domain-containing protein [Gammaproteobacteria bacterium]